MENTATKDPVIAIKEMADKFATLQDSQAAIQKTLAALEGSIHTTTGEVIKKGAEGVNANLEDSGIAGTMDKITNWRMFDIPVGAAVIGGVAGVFITELTDGLCVKFNIKSPYIAGAIKLGEAAAIVKWGKKFVGKDTANIVALLLTFDAVVNDFAPQLFNGINGFTNKLTGTTTAAGLSPKRNATVLGFKGTIINPGNKVVTQATTVAQQYQKAGV
jgi:putative heme iron utilization protein